MLVVVPNDEYGKVEKFFENNSEDKVPELFKKCSSASEINVNEIVVYEILEE